MRIAIRRARYTPAPWHFLNFLPEPHQQGSLRPIFSCSSSTRVSTACIGSSSHTPASGWPTAPPAPAAAARALGWSGPPPVYWRLPVEDEPVGGVHIWPFPA